MRNAFLASLLLLLCGDRNTAGVQGYKVESKKYFSNIKIGKVYTAVIEVTRPGQLGIYTLYYTGTDSLTQEGMIGVILTHSSSRAVGADQNTGNTSPEEG